MLLDSIVKRTPIDKGWSADRKYLAEAAGGSVYLLRISPLSRLEAVKNGFGRMRDLADMGVSICLPLEQGVCAEGVYCIQSWINGTDAERWIPARSGEQQYAYGLEAGRLLKSIHSISAPESVPPWGERYGRKIDRKISMYQSCPLRYENDGVFLRYLEENGNLLKDRPQTFQHGDYHIGNMMVDRDGKLVVIDFDRWDYGDPWEEFNRIVWSAQASEPFAAGMVDGYFNGTVPAEFWRLLALYLSCNTLGSLPWAIDFGEGEIQTMRDQAAQVLTWYSRMKTPVPSWYGRGRSEWKEAGLSCRKCIPEE